MMSLVHDRDYFHAGARPTHEQSYRSFCRKRCIRGCCPALRASLSEDYPALQPYLSLGSAALQTLNSAPSDFAHLGCYRRPYSSKSSRFLLLGLLRLGDRCFFSHSGLPGLCDLIN